MHEPGPREFTVPVRDAELYVREIGQGTPVIVLHGGPDFDHTYLLPELDVLSDRCRLIYYDQRGRGRSAPETRPADVSIASEVRDLDDLRRYLRLDTVALLGHSWGGLLALEYLTRHPQHVSHLILLNSAPAARDDLLLFRESRRVRTPADVDELAARAATDPYRRGDPDAVADYYRVHYRATVRQPEVLQRLIAALRSGFTAETILRGRAIEAKLVDETWGTPEYNVLSRLRPFPPSTLVIHGEQDFVPVECARHIADGIPGSRLVILAGVGHFSYLEAPGQVRACIAEFLGSQQLT